MNGNNYPTHRCALQPLTRDRWAFAEHTPENKKIIADVMRRLAAGARERIPVVDSGMPASASGGSSTGGNPRVVEKSAKIAGCEASLEALGNNANKCNGKPRIRAAWDAKRLIRQENLAYRRVHDCGRKTLGSHVALNVSKEHGTGAAHGLETCGSVWACPVCRAKILRSRAEEVNELQRVWCERGGRTWLLTLTIPHRASDNLSDLYGSSAAKTGLSGALVRLRASRTWRQLVKSHALGYLGDLRSIEVTHGKNGFHPHVHMLLFTKGNLRTWQPERSPFLDQHLAREWQRCCRAAGLGTPTLRRGVDVREHTDSRPDYIVKWGSADELVSDSAKAGRGGSRSIAELEAALCAGESVGPILREYYGAMRGKRLLQVAGQRGWREDLLGREIEDDQKLAEDEVRTETHRAVARVTSRAWLAVYDRGLIPDVLIQVEQGYAHLAQWWRRQGLPPGALIDRTGYEPKNE